MKEPVCYEDLNDIQTAAREVDNLRESLEAGDITPHDLSKYGPALELAQRALSDRAAQLTAEAVCNALEQRAGD